MCMINFMIRVSFTAKLQSNPFTFESDPIQSNPIERKIVLYRDRNTVKYFRCIYFFQLDSNEGLVSLVFLSSDGLKWRIWRKRKDRKFLVCNQYILMFGLNFYYI